MRQFLSDEELIREYVKESIKQKALQEGILSSATHVALDLVGLVPGLGEVADATNALLYAKEGDYLFAALSLISCIPELGDAIGKGGKIAAWLMKAGKAGKAVGATGRALRKLGESVVKNKGTIKKIINAARKNEKLKPHVDKMNDALEDFTKNTLGLDPNKMGNKQDKE